MLPPPYVYGCPLLLDESPDRLCIAPAGGVAQRGPALGILLLHAGAAAEEEAGGLGVAKGARRHQGGHLRRRRNFCPQR